MPETSRHQRLAAAVVCVLVGGLLAYAVGARLPGLRTPPAVGFLVAGVFFAAGAALFLQALGYARAAVVPVFLLVATMAGVGGWIGFGPGSRQCRGSVGVVPFRVDERACRVVFGSGALLTGLIAVGVLRSLTRGKPD